MPQRDKKFWIAPKMWPDNTCYILGGGPSLKSLDINRLQGKRIIAVNQAYKLASWIPVMFFGDCRWLLANRKALLHFPGLKITTCEQHCKEPGIKVIKRRNNPPGISYDAGCVVWNLSSGACAINLAVLFGVKRIVLLGFDMRIVDNEHNWHSDYQRKKNSKHNPYSRFMRTFPAIADGLSKKHIECVNATPDSALNTFPHVKLEEVL
jgi:hypothetical protein